MEQWRHVDIIIPVYNAYASLTKCVDSVLRYTDFSNARLVLVNDKSTDLQILPYLRELNKCNKNVLLLENAENLGFVRTINHALRKATGDVILLNSDTIVTPDWMQLLQQAAYSSASVGTVTPLSNNGSHCTIPMIALAEDSLEESILRTQSYVQATSFKSYPNIGVGVGFCLYIRREVLDNVGLLDAETFGKGYGEEVDFCLKAEQLGYKNILCDNLFIYHEGTASFSLKTKSKNMSAGDRIIKENYPEQYARVLDIAASSELSAWYTNIDIFRKLTNGKKNLLYLLQADFRDDASNNVGGTQFHVKDLVQELRNQFNLFVMARDGEYLRLTAYTSDTQISFKFFIGRPPQFAVFHDQVHYALYMDILRAFRIDIVHIHHTCLLTLDLYYAANELGIPLLASIHDFYTICPTIDLVKKRTELCLHNNTCDTDCKECLRICYKISPAIDYIANWRKEHKQALEMCTCLFIPSESAKDIFLNCYPSLSNKVRVIPHGMNPLSDIEIASDVFKSTDSIRYRIESTDEELRSGLVFGWCYLENKDSNNSKMFIRLSSIGQQDITIPIALFKRGDVAAIDPKYINSGFTTTFPIQTLAAGTWNLQIIIRTGGDSFISQRCCTVNVSKKKSERKFNVAFIGGLSENKGSQIAYKMITQGSKDINWYLFGGIGDRLLDSLKQPNLFKTNWYRREELKTLFEIYKIDLVCIFPIVSETFCYTLSEAVACHRPVLISDIGALGERMREMDCGWILPANATIKDRLKKIDEIRANPQMLAEAIERTKRYHHRTATEMASDYSAFYNSIPTNHFDMSPPEDMQMIYRGYLIGESTLAIGANDQNFFALQNRITDLENQLTLIHDSLGYKAVVAFSRLPIPFKDTLKWLLLKCYHIARYLHFV